MVNILSPGRTSLFRITPLWCDYTNPDTQFQWLKL